MKKFGGIIALTLLLAGLIFAVLYLKNEEEEATSEPFKDFAIKDTASIETFRISDTENNTITITRKKDGKTWMIGDSEFRAQPNTIELLMETFYRIKIKQDVPEESVENVLTSLSVRHKKVEFWMKGDSEPSKTWYVGSATQDHMGTYMLLKMGNKKSTIPYIGYKPDMYGTLDVRFFTSFKEWRYTGVFNYNSKEIKSIKVQFNDAVTDSYEIISNEEDVTLMDNMNMPVAVFDSSQVKHYLTHYKEIFYNKVNDELSQEQVDSVRANIPHSEITVTDINNEKKHVKMWKIKMPEGFTDNNHRLVEWDPEYAWIQINDSEELFKIQFFSWDVLFKPRAYFER